MEFVFDKRGHYLRTTRRLNPHFVGGQGAKQAAILWWFTIVACSRSLSVGLGGYADLGIGHVSENRPIAGFEFLGFGGTRDQGPGL